MKIITPVFAAASIIAGVATVYLFQQLDAERLRSAALQNRVTELELAQVRQPRATASSPLVQHAGAPATALAGDQPPVPGTPIGDSAVAKSKSTSASISSTELMQDPDYRAGAAASLRQSLLQVYPDLARELDLSAQQTSKLLDILANKAMAADTGSAPVNPRDAVESNREAQRRVDAEILALLGDAKNQQWKEYQQSLPTRQSVGRLRATLESSGGSLNQRQQQQLIATITAEQKNRSAEMTRVTQSMGRTPGEMVSMLEQIVRTTEEGNSRVLDLASSYLNAQQLDALRVQQNQALAVNRAMVRAERARSSTGDAATAMAAAPAAQ